MQTVVLVLCNISTVLGRMKYTHMYELVCNYNNLNALIFSFKSGIAEY